MMKNSLLIKSLESDPSIQLIHLLLVEAFDFNKRLNSNQRSWLYRWRFQQTTISNLYVHRGKQPVDENIYLKECPNRPFVDKYHSNGNFVLLP